MSNLFETLKEDARTIFTPRGNLSKAGQNLCFFLALVALVVGVFTAPWPRAQASLAPALRRRGPA